MNHPSDMNKGCGSAGMLKAALAVLTVAAALAGCNKQNLQTTYDNQDKKIEQYVTSQISASKAQRVFTNAGSTRLVISEGAGVDAIVKEMEAKGEEVPRDAFGHVKLDAINPGKWFGKQFAEMIGAEKVLVQKSGYFARSAPANQEDLTLIKGCVDLAVDAAMRGESGVIGHDEAHQDRLRPIEFERIKGGKPFNIALPWFRTLLREIGQSDPRPAHSCGCH